MASRLKPEGSARLRAGNGGGGEGGSGGGDGSDGGDGDEGGGADGGGADGGSDGGDGDEGGGDGGGGERGGDTGNGGKAGGSGNEGGRYGSGADGGGDGGGSDGGGGNGGGDEGGGSTGSDTALASCLESCSTTNSPVACGAASHCDHRDPLGLHARVQCEGANQRGLPLSPCVSRRQRSLLHRAAQLHRGVRETLQHGLPRQRTKHSGRRAGQKGFKRTTGQRKGVEGDHGKLKYNAPSARSCSPAPQLEGEVRAKAWAKAWAWLRVGRGRG
eukprot:scaffold126443_cov54-Phaeocystis_antarctica.AAC.3